MTWKYKNSSETIGPDRLMLGPPAGTQAANADLRAMENA